MKRGEREGVDWRGREGTEAQRGQFTSQEVTGVRCEPRPENQTRCLSALCYPVPRTVGPGPLRHRAVHRQVGYFLQRRLSQDAAPTPSLQGGTCAQLIRKET